MRPHQQGPDGLILQPPVACAWLAAVRQYAAGGLALLAAGFAQAEGNAIVWTLDDLNRIGGHVTEVIGTPFVQEGATVFDGIKDGMVVPDLPIAGAAQFTIEVLLQPVEGGGLAQRFVHLQDKAGFRALLEIRCNGRGGWWLDTFILTDAPSPERGLVLVDPARVHPTSAWYWVALRYNGSTMAHFVNGEMEKEAPASFAAFGQGKTSIGVRQNRVSWFKGVIREIRFANTALPAEKLRRMPH